MYLVVRCVLLIFYLENVVAANRKCPSQEAILPCRCLTRGEELQLWCSHSNLPRVLESLKAVSHHMKEPIDELILENNLLPSLPGRTFSPLKVLRLMLRDNALERVSGEWVVGLESSLMEIFIVEEKLRHLPDDSFLKLESLQAITIQSKALKRIPLLSGLPKLRYIHVESLSLMELSPFNFKKNPRLEKVHISNSPRVTRLEEYVFSDLPVLDLINITNCGLSWIHPRALYRLPALKEIILTGNKFMNVGILTRVSRNLPRLEILRADNNYIDRLGEGAFLDLPSLKKVYLANNLITELHYGAFHKVPSLRTLDLNRNMVKVIHPESFLHHSENGLEELLLSDNEISNVAELRSLLKALPKLLYLDMQYNNLEVISFGALGGHATLEYINLSYNRLRVIDKEAFMAMPALRELRLKNNSLSEDLLLPFWNLPALKGLDLSENYFKRLKTDLLDNLPSLRRLDLSSNYLGRIDPSSFLLTPSLEHVNISNNRLKVIEPTTFRNLLNLYELDASDNELKEFVPGLPKAIEYLHMQYNEILELPQGPSPDLDLPSLRMLNLNSNRIQVIPNRALNSLPQLRRLFLGENLLHHLDGSSLEGLSHLEHLDLNGNGLVSMHPNSLRDTSELRYIDIQNNHMTIVLPDLFKVTEKLKKLNMSGNQLAELLPGTLDKNLQLEVIDLSNNLLVKFPKTLYGLSHLKVLDLTNNRIKHIDHDVLNTLTNIEEIRLSRNFIGELKEGIISQFRHLKTLHLDNNELEIIEPHSVSLLPVLKSLKFNRNKIKVIPNFSFNKLASLQTIELQENQIRSISPKAFNLIPQLVMLNLSHNQIQDVENAGLKSFHSLEMLDMSNNRLKWLKSGALDKMEWLVELRMDDNYICGVKGSVFNGMPRLRTLSLKNNRMASFPEHAVQRLRGNIAILDIDGNPLVCSCNMLWLQAWLQEALQVGPRCVDGTFLREMRLSRQDCTEEERTRSATVPDCETELLTSPGGFGNLDFFSKWIRKNISHGNAGNKNHLALSPEESDYFYDEYIDYPINQTLIDKDGKETITQSSPKRSSSTTQHPPHIIGDTPTLYAASKSKNHTNESPPKVSNSPSTSGFTFFGIPLNNLLGGAGRKADAAAPMLEKKSAITNMNNQRVSLGNAQSNSAYAGNIPHAFPSSLVYMQPPSIPELQGGFLPILPNDGGFRPIANPVVKNEPTNVTSNPKAASTTVPSDKTTLSNATGILNESLVGAVNISTAEQEIPTLETSNISINVSTPPTPLLIRGNITETTTIDEEKQKLQSNVTETTTSVITTTSNDVERHWKNTTQMEIVTSESPDSSTATLKPAILQDTNQTTATEKKSLLQEKHTTTSSALLIPGGQQLPHKVGVGGRSTVSRVPSPHLATTSSTYVQNYGTSLQSKYFLPDIPDPLPHRENKNHHENVSIDTNDKENWYFANYNSTNLKPFIAKVRSSSGRNFDCSLYLQICSIYVTFRVLF